MVYHISLFLTAFISFQISSVTSIAEIDANEGEFSFQISFIFEIRNYSYIWKYFVYFFHVRNIIFDIESIIYLEKNSINKYAMLCRLK